MGLLDFLFPKRCVGCRRLGSYICSTCFTSIRLAEAQICVYCNRPAIDGITHPSCLRRYGLSGTFAPFAYSGVIKRLFAAYKFQPHVSDLAETITQLLHESILENEIWYGVLAKTAFLIPIPLSAKKLRARGYNQSSLLAQLLAKKLGIPSYSLLSRIKETATQVGLSREARIANLKDAFTLRQKTPIAGKTIVLLDDILTSGATFAEAAKVLRRNGAGEVYGLAIAHGS